MGESGDLSTESPAPSNLIISGSALLLILAEKRLNFCIFAPKKSLVMKLTNVELFNDSLQLGP